MRLKLILIGAITALVAAGFVFVYVSSQRESRNTPSPIVFPTSSSLTGDTLSLAARDGEAIRVENFIQNGVTIADEINAGNYIIAGDLGYCLEDGTCPSTGQDSFTIAYFSDQQAFMIDLGTEPLGEVRRQAEQTLLLRLGISEEQACRLNISVGTTVYVNETYGSMGDLGLSFCPDAIILP